VRQTAVLVAEFPSNMFYYGYVSEEVISLSAR